MLKRRNRRRKTPPYKLSPFQLTIKSKTHPLARQTDQSKKATCPTHPNGKEETFSGLPCEKGELLVDHLKETSHVTILKLFFYFYYRGTKYWRSVLNTLSDATNYKFTPLQGDNHTSPSPQLFQVFFPLSFKTCFFLAYVVYNDKKLVCFTPGINFFFF